ncbi:MAG: substrate-binding domain-containing protein [Oscillospiraceae bacterium]|jgi:ribose transport system substrate-binding protein|nr:substrate-binding domain-containing protein [Oscillospiraceae bacterium]
MKMKKIAILALALCMLLVTACAPSAPANSGATVTSGTASAAESASQAPQEASVDAGGDKAFKVGFTIKTLDNPYFQALAQAVKDEGETRGWSVSVLDAESSIETELANMDTFISQGMDLIVIDNFDARACVPSIQQAYDAGIPVIAVDSGVDEDVPVVTIVYSNNKQNGRSVGLYANECYDPATKISSVLLSGDKGNPVGRDRRMGLFCGIIESRAKLSEEEAWAETEKFEQQLTDTGKAYHEAANFEVLAQGWAHWISDDGLPVMEDLLVANGDINCVLGENDNMLLGAMEALEAVNKLDQVQIFAAADGQKEALALIQQGTSYKGSGENNPVKCAALVYKIADEILVNGADRDSYPYETLTEAVAITPENVDELYNPNAVF